MRISILLAAAAATAAIGGTAIAGDKPADFTTLDADKSGALSKEEFKGALPADTTAERVEATFASMDKDKDGSISKEEATGGKASGGQTASAEAAAPASGDAASTSTK